MIRRVRALVFLVLAGTLTGCMSASDLDALRACRLALVARSESAASPTIVSQTVAAAPAGDRAAHIVASITTPSGDASETAAECLIGPTGKLKAMRVDRDVLSDTAVFFLQRFWLDTPEADMADPNPVQLWERAPQVSFATAYGLQTLLAALPGFAVYGLLAAAYSLVYGLVGRINLAFGAMAAVGGAASLAGLGLVPHAGASIALTVAVALAAALWAGLLHGIAIARWVFLPLHHTNGQQGLVATVGLALVLEEYLRIAQGPAPPWMVPLRAAPIGLAHAPDFIVTLTPLNLVVVVAFAIATLVLLVLMARSQFGRSWRAMADDPHAAALLGVDPTRLFGQTFALAAALAGAAGGVAVLLYGSFGGAFGTVLGLKALLAAIIGGIGSVPGAFLGALLIAAFEAFWSAAFSIDSRDLALFCVLSGLLIMRPGGLFGFGDLTPRRV